MKRKEKEIIKRIKKATILIGICDYMLLINLIMNMCKSGIMGKILDFIFVIY